MKENEEFYQAKMHVESKKVFVGDICYALNDAIYQSVWGDKHKFQDGVIDDNGIVYAVTAGTAYGDGNYRSDDNGRYFPVDAGNIGVTNLDYPEKGNMLGKHIKAKYGKTVTLPQEDIVVLVRYDYGVIYITISTDEKFNDIIYDVAVKTC